MNQETAPQPKKVLFLITKATWGGAQKYVHDLALALAPETYHSMVVYGVAGRLSHVLAERGIALRCIPSLAREIAFFSDIQSFFLIWYAILKERPEVLHLNSSKAAAFGALAGRLSGVPRIIFTVHGWPFKEERGPIGRAAIRFVSWFTALLSHAVIVVSKHDESLAYAMPGVSVKTVYIPLGIAALSYMTREQAERVIEEKIGRPLGSALRLVTIGELTKNKGIRYGIETVALLKARGIAATYVVLHDGEERGALEQYARERDVGDSVFLPGFIPDAAQYLPAFDVFLLPSIKEGAPYVVLEAAGAGLPIVATSVIDADTAENLGARLVPPKNAAALSDAVVAASKTASAPLIPSLEEMVRKTSALYKS